MLNPSQGLSSVSCSASEEMHKKPGENMARAGDKLAKGIFHSIEQHTQDRNWGHLAPGTDHHSETGWASVSG